MSGLILEEACRAWVVAPARVVYEISKYHETLIASTGLTGSAVILVVPTRHTSSITIHTYLSQVCVSPPRLACGFASVARSLDQYIIVASVTFCVSAPKTSLACCYTWQACIVCSDWGKWT